MCIAILQSPQDNLIISKNTIYRDITFFILTTLVILAFAIFSYIYWYFAAVKNKNFFLIY